MKTFNIPEQYKSGIIQAVKQQRKLSDPRKTDFTPTLLNFGPVRFWLARHFGFCYGVENAIEIAWKALAENTNKRVFLLSQMIHNPFVNNDLQEMGITFILDTEGRQLFPWSEISPDDVVIIPAFGTTLEIESILNEIGVETQKYNTTCPFVERVWNKAEKLGGEKYSIVIHGKPSHEETRATFSHSKANAPSIVIRNMDEAKILGEFITGAKLYSEFDSHFAGRYSADFIPEESLEKLGVVNQTTMLASDTQEITDHLRICLEKRYGIENLKDHFADTRDTLCYATNDNQRSTFGLLNVDADLAIVVGGYNSSNTSHLVELLEQKFPTYFVSGADEIKSSGEIHHFNYPSKKHVVTRDFMPSNNPVNIILTSGASCPDAMVEKVMTKILSWFDNTLPVDAVIQASADGL